MSAWYRNGNRTTPLHEWVEEIGSRRLKRFTRFCRSDEKIDPRVYGRVLEIGAGGPG